MKKRALLIFAKNPEHGKVKTRLAATVGAEKAFAVYMQLLEQTMYITKLLPLDKYLFYSDYVEEAYIWDKAYNKQVQRGKDLGERMSNAFSFAFNLGYEEAVIIGTDCPELDAGAIITAFEQLDVHDVVIGPAADGGYYLLGMKQHHPQLFVDIGWSTPTVLEDSLNICKTRGMSYSALPVLHDVDEEKDLVYLKKESV